jgi:hypothetical protein
MSACSAKVSFTDMLSTEKLMQASMGVLSLSLKFHYRRGIRRMTVEYIVQHTWRSAMKVAFCLGLILLLTFTSVAAIPKQDTIGIYLFAGSIDPRGFARHPGRWKDLPLAGKPIFTNADIIAYDFSKHAMKLEPEALKRLPRPPVEGTPFVVVVNGERIYPGAFYCGISSIPCELPVIVVDRRALDPTSPADILLIESAYPPQSSALGKDLRSDVRVRDALANLKKLSTL